ncbi:MAG: hypothetical protein Q8N63_06300, partial [Nanoarchaeota archaeon]|nr:hypothetical protein [Nanoarchaeota archaeon]
FDSLSENIFKLLQLFEISAKTFVEKETPELGEKKKDREFLDKLDKLLEQNKVIAKGLTLMEDKLKERIYGNKPEVEGIIGENLRKPFAPQSQPAPFSRMPANVEGRPRSPEGRPRYPKSPGYPSF